MAAGNYEKSRAFTLIELLVTIAVIVIIATIAVPNFQNMISSNRMVAEYNQILSGLHYSRSEAVKKRESISFNLDSSSDKWLIEVKDEDNVSLRVISPKDAMSSLDDIMVKFSSLGRLMECNDSDGNDVSPCVIDIGSLAIEINAAGNISKSE